ncbi:MAG: 60S ribosomal protein L31 [Nanoarchaeota archaeon]|nr:60S ribosomal protein L31 [Nanoarchaeota archaeon]MBU1004899.1 60S ribosomal protein L31 [Nanoarchaeota archaeon]
MAKKEEKESKIVLERVYNVPLRKKYRNAPNWKRTKRAVTALREFIQKHMKSKDVKIGKYANLDLWKHGIKNPPHHIKVNCIKYDDGIVRAEIIGAPQEKPKEEPKKAEKDEIKVKDALGGNEEKTEKLEEKEVKEEKSEKAKDIQKEEIKELKKEESTLHKHAPKQAAAPKKVEQRPTAPMQKG